ncbi:MAG: FAD-binding oxidoreductase [Desulfococcaceae bacterium]
MNQHLSTELLQETLRGILVRPEDSAYDDARRVHNGMIDKRPRLIAQCADAADVMDAVRYGREKGMDIAVRGGGHGGPGLGVRDDALVIDLGAMNGVRVDPEARTARVDAGCRWRDVDHAAHPFGLGAVSGIISSTGVGGLTLGGGHGYLSRKYGLAADNLLAADLVLADGRFVQASEIQHPDLFWAIRGGGGNFGVATSFLFRLHPVGHLVGGVTFWPLDQAGEILRWYRDYISRAPEEMYGAFAFLVVPPAPPFPEALHGKNLCGVIWCHTGPEVAAEDAFAHIRQVHPPLFEHIGPLPYPNLQSMFDDLYPPGQFMYWKGDFVRELSDAAIEKHLEYGGLAPNPPSTMHLYPINGAVHRVGPEETAFQYRDATWSMVIVGVDPEGENQQAVTDWAKDYWTALRPHSAEGGYLNFMMEEGADRIRATYGDNFDRLSRVKKRYDPENLFHVNQNIPPAA